MYTYHDYPTVNVEGMRVYQISDDKYYPSITTILGRTLEPEKQNVLGAWRARVGNKKADEISLAATTRGTNLHLMLERHFRGEDPKIEEFPVEHVKMYNSLRLELRKINKAFGIEVVLFSDTLQIAGRCDLVAEYQGELAIVDYKSSGRWKDKNEIDDYWLQAAFYATAHNEMFGTEISKAVIMMGVENKLPMIFRKTIDEELVMKLADRVTAFYKKI